MCLLSLAHRFIDHNRLRSTYNATVYLYNDRFVTNFIYMDTLDNCHLEPFDLYLSSFVYGFIFLFPFEGGIMTGRDAQPHISCARCE